MVLEYLSGTEHHYKKNHIILAVMVLEYLSGTEHRYEGKPQYTCCEILILRVDVSR